MAQAVEVDVSARPADAPRFLVFVLARDSYFVCWQLPAEVRSCLRRSLCAACSVCAGLLNGVLSCSRFGASNSTPSGQLTVRISPTCLKALHLLTRSPDSAQGPQVLV